MKQYRIEASFSTSPAVTRRALQGMSACSQYRNVFTDPGLLHQLLGDEHPTAPLPVPCPIAGALPPQHGFSGERGGNLCEHLSI